jgi:hypothetical protein
MSDLPPGVTIAPPPPELKLDDERGDNYWYPEHGNSWRERKEDIAAFPERIEVDPPDLLRTTKPFGCSGSIDSYQYREATKFREMTAMTWPEARIALRRLSVLAPYDGDRPASEYIGLAEFALTATGFARFAGNRGEHAVKLHDELGKAVTSLHERLERTLHTVEHNAGLLARPVTQHGDPRDGSKIAATNVMFPSLWTKVPTAADEWVRVIDATPDQVIAALDFLRATFATWEARRAIAADIVCRLAAHDPKALADLPTAAEYAEAIHIADTLAFTGNKLLALYAGVMLSMPVYRLYPGTPELEAIALWWPWGRPAVLIDGGPSPPPKPRKQVLDPAIITARRPQDIVKEVVQKTGMNRTTAQRLTAAMRTKMRAQRKTTAERLLRQGVTKAEVARMVELSPSRISAMFKGEAFPTKRRRRVFSDKNRQLG